MARQSFKRWWAHWLPESLERAVYVGLSGLLLAGLVWTWQPLPGEPLWRLPSAFVIVPLLAGVGLGWTCGFFDQGAFYGLRQAGALPPECTAETLQVRGPYRYVRHPLMTFLLLFLWAQPIMQPTLLALSAGFSLYILLAIRWEERDLMRQFGPAYESYRRRVPALLPWRLPAVDG
jgi:protein-S-isoprenylcysteine O-methyltransferase Ste14